MFKTLSSETRRKILSILTRGELHISGIAKEIGISVPGVVRHCKILEKEGLIKRRKFGRAHVLSINSEVIKGSSLKQKPRDFNFKLQEDYLKIVMPSVNPIKVSRIPRGVNCDSNSNKIKIKF
jgi:predicted transcriptional regulator